MFCKLVFEQIITIFLEFHFHVQHAKAFSGEKKRIFSIEIFGAEDGCTASSTDCTNLTMKAAAVIRRQWKTNGCGGNTHSRKKWEPKNAFPLFFEENSLVTLY